MFGSTKTNTTKNLVPGSSFLRRVETTTQPSSTPSTLNRIGTHSFYSDVYSTTTTTTHDNDETIFYSTPHSSNLVQDCCQEEAYLKNSSFPKNPPISTQPVCKQLGSSLRWERPKSSQNYLNNCYSSSQNKTTRTTIVDKESDDFEDCFVTPTFSSPSYQHHDQHDEVSHLTDYATPVSKLSSSSTISKKSPLLTEEYDCSTTSSTTGNTTSSKRTNKSSRESLKSSSKSWKTCHSFKAVNNFTSSPQNTTSTTNYSSSFVMRESHFNTGYGHYSNSSSSNDHNCRNQEKKAIFELSINEDDLRILEEGIPLIHQQSNLYQTPSWLNAIPPQQFPTINNNNSNNSNNNEKNECLFNSSSTITNPPPPNQVDQLGNFTKSQIETNNNTIKDHTSLKRVLKPNNVDNDALINNNRSLKIHNGNQFNDNDADGTSHHTHFDHDNTTKCSSVPVPKCANSSGNTTTSSFLGNLEINRVNDDGLRCFCASSPKVKHFKSCMEEKIQFKPEKKQAEPPREFVSTVVLSSKPTTTASGSAPIEHFLNEDIDIDCAFLPSPILPKESLKSNNTSFHINNIDSLIIEETKTSSLEKQALIKPDNSSTSSSNSNSNNINTEQSNKMLKAVSIRNELNHYPTQLQFIRMPVGGNNINKPSISNNITTTTRKEHCQPVKHQQPEFTTTPIKKNQSKQENTNSSRRPAAAAAVMATMVSELACSFKSNGLFQSMMDESPINNSRENMDIDDCEEFEKNKQRFKNKFIKRRAKLFLNDQVNIITARSLSENLRILTEKACLLQRLKLQLEEKTLSIQSVCDRIVHEDLSWQLEDVISAASTDFWSSTTCCYYPVNTATPSSLFQFLNRVCESENEVINAIEDLIDFVITSAKRMCKRHSLNINIILDTIRESTATATTLSTTNASQLKSAKGMSKCSSNKQPNFSPISSHSTTSTNATNTSHYYSSSSLTNKTTSKNVSTNSSTNFDQYSPCSSSRSDEIFDIKKRNELFEIIENNVDTVLDICSAIRHYTSDEKMETLDTVFEDKFSAYCKILDEMKTYSDLSLYC